MGLVITTAIFLTLSYGSKSLADDCGKNMKDVNSANMAGEPLTPQIKIYNSSEVPSDLQLQIDQRIHEEFGNVPIVRNHIWAKPDWTFVALNNGELVSFLSIIERT